MKIYKDELEIRDRIESNNSLAYCAYAEEASGEEIDIINKSFRGSNIAKASIKDEDLFYHKSILVTTNWNNNDDIFTPEETWASKNTPIHKPTNLNHVSNKIVGHITGSWAIDNAGNLLNDDLAVDDLPSKFHILTGSVIYKTITDDDGHREAIAELIDDIKNGRQAVSMECLFADFDYAFQKDGELNIVERNHSTACVTKHLRAYGGEGEYEGYKVGRVLKNIIFSGKGYTKNPANKESVIFTEKDIFDFANAKKIKTVKPEKLGVTKNSSNTFYGAHFMSTSATSTEQLTPVVQVADNRLADENKALAEELKSLKEELAKANVAKFEETIKEQEASIATLTESKEKAEKSLDEALAKMNEQAEASQALSKENEELKAQAKEAALATLRADRVTQLVDLGVEKSEAEETVGSFIDLDDDRFGKLVAVYSKKSEKKEEKKDEAVKDEAAKAESDTAETSEVAEAESTTDEATENLEEAKASESATVNAPEVDETNLLISELSKAFAEQLNTEKK